MSEQERPRVVLGDKDRAEIVRLGDKYGQLVFETNALYNRSILALSSGFLAVSVGFISDLGGPDPNPHIWLLSTSWVFFGGAILFTLANLLFFAKSCEREAVQLAQFYLSGKELPNTSGSSFSLQVSAGGIFAAGVVCTIIFAALTVQDARLNERSDVSAVVRILEAAPDFRSTVVSDQS